MENIDTCSAIELNRAFLRGEISAEKIASLVKSSIKDRDRHVRAFLEIYDLEEEAKLLDERRKRGAPLGSLAAVPVAIKDNIHIKGKKTTCASRMLEHYLAPFDASVIKWLKKADALLIGKTNMDEFGMGSTTEHSAFHVTYNPWDLDCTPGGSSGGSAAAVSSGICPLALGSDTGGSVRLPAAFTGVIGFKPTYGRVSRYGLVAFSSSLDQIGPLGNSVADIALAMDVIAQPCYCDPTMARELTHSYLDKLCEVKQSFIVGVPWHFLENLSEEVKSEFVAGVGRLEELGGKIVEVELDILSYAVSTYHILSTAEASTNLARFDGIHFGYRSKSAKTLAEVYTKSRQEGFGSEVKTRILLGTYALSSGYTHYRKAQQMRHRISADLENVLAKCDVISLPTAPSAAFPLGKIQDALEVYLQDIYTLGASLAGLPAISIPCGKDSAGKPLGLQLIGKRYGDIELLQLAHLFCPDRVEPSPLLSDSIRSI